MFVWKPWKHYRKEENKYIKYITENNWKYRNSVIRRVPFVTVKMVENVNIDLSGEMNVTTEKRGFQKYVTNLEL